MHAPQHASPGVSEHTPVLQNPREKLSPLTHLQVMAGHASSEAQ